MKSGKTMWRLAPCAGAVLITVSLTAAAQGRKPDVHFVSTPEVVVERRSQELNNAGVIRGVSASGYASLTACFTSIKDRLKKTGALPGGAYSGIFGGVHVAFI